MRVKNESAEWEFEGKLLPFSWFFIVVIFLCVFFFFVFEKKKTMVMCCCLLLWCCCSEKGDGSLLPLPSSLVVFK
jgi:hypothetical protein